MPSMRVTDNKGFDTTVLMSVQYQVRGEYTCIKAAIDGPNGAMSIVWLPVFTEWWFDATG
jgi:hypothetical protein